MKKIIFCLLILLSATSVKSQKDFDYTIYTTKTEYWGLDSTRPGVELLLHRKIKKEADVIKIISLTNTGDAQTYHVNYVGYDIQSKSFLYVVEEGKTIYINPMEPIITIVNDIVRTKIIYR